MDESDEESILLNGLCWYPRGVRPWLPIANFSGSKLDIFRPIAIHKIPFICSLSESVGYNVVLRRRHGIAGYQRRP